MCQTFLWIFIPIVELLFEELFRLGYNFMDKNSNLSLVSQNQQKPVQSGPTNMNAI